MSKTTWVDLNSNTTVNLDQMWLQGQPNGQDIQESTTFHVKNGKFDDVGSSFKSCFVCAWIKKPLFILRGLCSNSKIDHQYVLLPQVVYNDRMFFWGFGENNI